MRKTKSPIFSGAALALAVLLLATWCPPAGSAEYDRSLKGVARLDVVFAVGHGIAKSANVTFWAVRDVYRNETVNKLPAAPRAVLVFYGPAVKLLSMSREGVTKEEGEEMDAFATTLKTMKSEGVTLEVCMYAVKMKGVDPATLLPEIDRVPNGFVSVAGYQNQGYAVVTIP